MTARIEAPGVYPGIPAEDYHADKLLPGGVWSLSSSGARQIMLECPARYAHDKRNPPESTKAMALGSVAHRLVLEGKGIEDTHIAVPAGFSMAHVKKHGDLIERIEASGLPTIREEDVATVEGMAAALRADPIASAAFTNGTVEQSLFYWDDYFGIWCRCRLDFAPSSGTIFTDFKTCVSAEPEAIRRAIRDYGLHQQAAWNCDAIRRLGLCTNPTFLFLFQEKAAPWLITPVVLGEATLDWGSRLNGKAKSLFANGLRTGHWPGYCDDVITVDLPGYEMVRLQNMDELGQLAIELQTEPGWKHAA